MTESRERYFTGNNPQLDSILARIADRLDILEGLRPDLSSGLYKLESNKAITTTPKDPTGPATSVLTSKSYGQSESVGTGELYARNDHKHGSPPEPVAVGGYYLNSTGVNPATELGYGTWTQVGKGQFILGAP